MPLKNLLDSTRDALNLLMEEVERSRRELEQAGLPTETFAAVMQAREHLDRGLQSPRVRIAVTGTTSSGKSSLLNFLCGEELLPTGVQEKSAGLVRIVHDEHVSLEIAATPGCRWESGFWADISGEEVQTRLDAVMDAFLKERDAGNRPAPPSAVIHYPTWLGKKLGIQEQAGLELLDLPGLRSCRDDSLNELVRECRDALCLVTFLSCIPCLSAFYRQCNGTGRPCGDSMRRWNTAGKQRKTRAPRCGRKKKTPTAFCPTSIP